MPTHSWNNMSYSGGSGVSSSSSGSSGSGSSRNRRGSARGGNNGSWKRDIRFKTTADDKSGKRKSFFKSILDGYNITGYQIPASWYTAVWDTQDNKLVTFATKVALHAHMRDDEDVHYASNLKYVINNAKTIQHAMSCTADKKHYCITHVAARYANDPEHIKQVKDMFVKKFSASNWKNRAGKMNHQNRIASNYLNPRTENNNHGHKHYNGVKLSNATMKKRMAAQLARNKENKEEAQKQLENARRKLEEEKERARREKNQLVSQILRFKKKNNPRFPPAQSSRSRSQAGPSGVGAGRRRHSALRPVAE